MPAVFASPASNHIPWLVSGRESTVSGLEHAVFTMAPVTISLPRLQLECRQDQLDAVIQGFFVVDLPSSMMSTVLTVEDLSRTVSEEQLWINRVGPCRLRISVSVSGKPLSDLEHALTVVNWVQTDEVTKSTPQTDRCREC